MSNYRIQSTAIERGIQEIEATMLDVSKFEPMSIKELEEILGLTIKRDEIPKLITFLSMLSAYTEDSQMNVSNNAPSSTGKSFIPLEISYLFPKEDTIKLGNCSPTAFYHEQGIFDKERNVIIVNLERKIIIFLDQPSNALLTRLRALLSHDEREIQAKITDKNQKGGNRTKTVVIRGFPVVIFCTAGLNIDEQEATRFFLLSPEVSKEKIEDAIKEKIRKESSREEYQRWLDDNPKRKLLKERILAIRDEHIIDIRIDPFPLLEQMFFERIKVLKPRHQRDIARVASTVKVLALLNSWFRKRDGSTITANEDDIKNAFVIWDAISESQELGIPPYVYNLYKDVILTAYRERNSENDSGVGRGLTRPDIIKKHFEMYHRHLPDWQLRHQILPPLDSAGLIVQEPDQSDRRRMLIYPTASLTISQSQNNSESDSGVSPIGQQIDDGFLVTAEEIFGAKAK